MNTLIQDLDDSKKRSNATTILKYYEEYVAPKIPSFKTGFIHGDPNGNNIIVKPDTKEGDYSLIGLIDYGDCLYSCTIFDLGICLAYMMFENLNPVHCSSTVEFVGPLIHGYNSILPLDPDEFDSLYYLVLARCVQSAVMGEYSFKAEPWNAYLIISPKKAWALIEVLLSTSKENVDLIWRTFL